MEAVNKNFKNKIKVYFTGFNKQFFDNKLSDVRLECSQRMKKSAGMFYAPKKGEKYSKIILNQPMLESRKDREIKETLLHEMTHAFLWVEGKKVKPHGKEFHEKVKVINDALGLNITSKHKYFSWYRCNGKCREVEANLYGYRTSSSGQPLNTNSGSFKNHQIICGGIFKESIEPDKEVLDIILKLGKKKKAAIKKPSKRCDKIGSLFPLRAMQQSPLKTIDYSTSDEEI